MSLLPRTLLVRTFLLISLLIFLTVATWLSLFALAEREPRARQLAQLTVSVVNLTRAALIAADPVKRHELLRDLAEREGVRLYPAESSDVVEALPKQPFFRIMRNAAQAQLGPNARFASSVTGQAGLWAKVVEKRQVRDHEVRVLRQWTAIKCDQVEVGRGCQQGRQCWMGIHKDLCHSLLAQQTRVAQALELVAEALFRPDENGFAQEGLFAVPLWKVSGIFRYGGRVELEAPAVLAQPFFPVALQHQ